MPRQNHKLLIISLKNFKHALKQLNEAERLPIRSKKARSEQSKTSVEKIYGCATTGDDWKFMCLEDNIIKVDRTTYYKSDLEKILGVFQVIMDYYKAMLN